MANQSSENPTGTLNVRDKEALGRHSELGLLRYRDFDAGYCNACGLVFNVQCPKCKANSGAHGSHIDPIFTVSHPIEPVRQEGQVWISVQCRKCDFRFKVMVKGANDGAYTVRQDGDGPSNE